jgi:hypothetical protein
MISSPVDPGKFMPDGIEFELTNIDEARRAHDALPEGVDKLPELVPDYWQQRRRKPQPTDRALAGFAIDWLIALPPALRPHALCERYPRAANALAAAWHCAERGAVLDDLLGNKRGKRRGFPVDVRIEIEALRDASATLAPDDGA